MAAALPLKQAFPASPADVDRRTSGARKGTGLLAASRIFQAARFRFAKRQANVAA